MTNSNRNCRTARPHCYWNCWESKAHSGSEAALMIAAFFFILSAMGIRDCPLGFPPNVEPLSLASAALQYLPAASMPTVAHMVSITHIQIPQKEKYQCLVIPLSLHARTPTYQWSNHIRWSHSIQEAPIEKKQLEPVVSGYI